VRIHAAQLTKYADCTHRHRMLTPKPATGEPCPIVAWLLWQTLLLFAAQAAQLRSR
jgi:hypothetical protein